MAAECTGRICGELRFYVKAGALAMIFETIGGIILLVIVLYICWVINQDINQRPPKY